MSRLNPIAFPITQALRNAHDSDANASLFSVDRLGLTGNYLVLWVFPEDYTSAMRMKDIKRGAVNTFVFPSSEPYTFEVNIKDGRQSVIEILRAIEGDTVTVFDFHVADGSTPYTVREGVISIEPGGTFYSEQYGNLSPGFRLTFEEV